METRELIHESINRIDLPYCSGCMGGCDEVTRYVCMLGNSKELQYQVDVIQIEEDLSLLPEYVTKEEFDAFYKVNTTYNNVTEVDEVVSILNDEYDLYVDSYKVRLMNKFYDNLKKYYIGK